VLARLDQHRIQQLLADRGANQPLAVLGEYRHVQTSSSISRPTNQQNRRLYCIGSINCRSLRIEYSTVKKRRAKKPLRGTVGHVRI